jgi:hypothetical protein
MHVIENWAQEKGKFVKILDVTNTAEVTTATSEKAFTPKKRECNEMLNN